MTETWTVQGQDLAVELTVEPKIGSVLTLTSSLNRIAWMQGIERSLQDWGIEYLERNGYPCVVTIENSQVECVTKAPCSRVEYLLPRLKACLEQELLENQSALGASAGSGTSWKSFH
jgi:hypothetical protein